MHRRQLLDRRHLLTGAAMLGGIAAVSACAPGSGTSDKPSGPAAKDVKTDIDSLGDLTLKVWDQEVRGSQNDAITKLIDEFQKKHKNIKIDRVKQSFDDLQKQTALALSGKDVPDVLQVNNARADMGEFVKAGQLLDLSGYAEAYGWEKRFPDSVLSKARYSSDAKTFGSGSLWGLPQTGEVCGIYYSAKKLKGLGVEPPKSWDDLRALLEKAESAGEQPIMLGNLDKWPALHVFGPLQAATVDPKEVTALAMGNKGGDWTDAKNVAALTEFGDWAKKKYFGTSPNGLDYDAAWASFTKGKGVLLIGGSWLGTDMEKAMGDDLHFMAPPAGESGKVATTGGTGLPFSIPAKAKNQEAAAAYIDFITSEEAMKLIAENGGMPVLDTAKLAPSKGVNKEIFEAFDKVSTEGTLVPYLDYATPSFSDTAGATLQELIGGQASPQDAAGKLQKDYSAFVKAS